MNLEEQATNEIGKEMKHMGKFMSTSMRSISNILDKNYDENKLLRNEYGVDLNDYM